MSSYVSTYQASAHLGLYNLMKQKAKQELDHIAHDAREACFERELLNPLNPPKCETLKNLLPKLMKNMVVTGCALGLTLNALGISPHINDSAPITYLMARSAGIGIAVLGGIVQRRGIAPKYAALLAAGSLIQLTVSRAMTEGKAQHQEWVQLHSPKRI